MANTSRDKGVENKPQMVEFFGENVFSVSTMRRYLSKSVFKSLMSTIREGRSLDPSIADEVASAMKKWALEKGATHFTHWFQPLTCATAEKHDSFIMPDNEGDAIYQFSGKELIKGEPDASSFPSGGLRATFEARGYTGWDPTSPAFIKECENGATLCIPTVFCSYHSEALDKKTPLLRSIAALSDQICRVARLFGIDCNGMRPYVTLGAEQEYFLVDKNFYENRLDLIQTGRTLFGRKPAKHQQMDDHYFSAINSRVLAFMCELDKKLWRLGVPVKTRHNEVCPAQFELAPVFEELNIAVDHNMIIMEMLREAAERHGFTCLLHEKPFARVNGSGKHNNWSVCGPDGKNWLMPGDNPEDHAKFLIMLCAIIKGVDTHASLLRASVATAGNDYRLGANEAPPAIMSIFLGKQLTEVIEQIKNGASLKSIKGGMVEAGVFSIPSLPRDITDRNRTSSLAYTSNKFEFRAVGSSQNCAGANIVLNTIVAEALDEICTQMEQNVSAGKDFNQSLRSVLCEIIKNHKRVIFNGDNYTAEWIAEAEKRGLPNLKTTPEALKALTDKKTVALFDKYKVLSERELKSRREIYQHTYDEVVSIEANCAVTMAMTMIAPAALRYQGSLADTINAVETVGLTDILAAKTLLKKVCSETEKLFKGIEKLKSCIDNRSSKEIIDAMSNLREPVDNLEGLLPNDLWPLPSYAEMMCMM